MMHVLVNSVQIWKFLAYDVNLPKFLITEKDVAPKLDFGSTFVFGPKPFGQKIILDSTFFFDPKTFWDPKMFLESRDYFGTTNFED